MQYREMVDLLKTAENVDEINLVREDIAGVIPMVRIMFDYDQQNKAHQYDLWIHSVHTVVNMPKNLPDDMLYIAALLHDIGKPDRKVAGTTPDDKDMHFFGHPERSMEIVRDRVIPDFERGGIFLTEDEKRRLLFYVLHHDDRVSLTKEFVGKYVELVSLLEFKYLMNLEVADAIAHVQFPHIKLRVEICQKLAGADGEALYREIIDED